MRILLDTNVILNIALERQPFYIAASRILGAFDLDEMRFSITASMATDIYYLLRKSKGREFARAFLEDLLGLLDVCRVDKSILLDALDSSFFDFEDAVQNAAAVEGQIDTIVTRNKADYRASPLMVLSPEEFVAAHLT